MGTYTLKHTGPEVDRALDDVTVLSETVDELAETVSNLASQAPGSSSGSGAIDCEPGKIFAYAGSGTPQGALLCNGQEVSRTTYSELFDTIGIRYGDGDGSTTFNLPNISSRTIIGESGSYELGTVGGEESHKLTVAEMPSHLHSWKGVNTGSDTTSGSYNIALFGIDSADAYQAQGKGGQPAGGDQPHNNMQPYIVMRYFITTGKGGAVSGGNGGAVEGGIIPADYVVEQGQTDIWTWTKYASGIAEFYGYKDFSIDFGGSDSAFAPVVSFPFELETLEYKDCSIVYSDGNEAMRIEAGGMTNKSLIDTGSYTIVARNATNIQSGTLFFKVKGTWKELSSGGTASGAIYGINPADYIIERGSDDTWTWVKYASGIAECWGEWTGTYESEIAADGYDYVDVSLPAIFAEREPAHITPSYQAYRIDKVYDNAEQMNDKGELVANVDYVRILVWADGSSIPTTTTFSFSLSVKGKWKEVSDSSKAVGHFDNATVENDLEVGGTLTVDGRKYGVNKVLWSGELYPINTQTATLSEAISAQPNGVVFVWSYYSGTAQNSDFNCHFVPKQYINLQRGGGISMPVFYADSSGNGGYKGVKYVYVEDTYINGHVGNNAGNNAYFALRYVIGV